MLCNLKGFLSARQLNPNTPVKLIKEELEPTEFKQYFNPWESFVSFGNTKTHGVGVGIATKGNIVCISLAPVINILCMTPCNAYTNEP